MLCACRHVHGNCLVRYKQQGWCEKAPAARGGCANFATGAKTKAAKAKRDRAAREQRKRDAEARDAEAQEARAAETKAAAKSFPSRPISKIPARSENKPAKHTNNKGVARRNELSKT